MKRIIYFLILACFIGCEKDEQNEKYFDPENLGLLDLANIDGFWDDDSNIYTSFNGGGQIFKLHPGFLGGIGLYNGDKTIVTSVFTTRDTAIIAMEFRINNVATPIDEGTSDEIEGTWWFLNDSWNSAVFVNQWNTIIEIRISAPNNEEIENTL